MDTISARERSYIMGLIHSRDTKPEWIVRRIVHKAGFRYRLHVKKLPGKPDLVFHSRKKIIFVHGCFWHKHPNCPQNRMPKSNRAFWARKLRLNFERDQRNLQLLQNAGWKVDIIWECETRSQRLIERKICRFLRTR